MFGPQMQTLAEGISRIFIIIWLINQCVSVWDMACWWYVSQNVCLTHDMVVDENLCVCTMWYGVTCAYCTWSAIYCVYCWTERSGVAIIGELTYHTGDIVLVGIYWWSIARALRCLTSFAALTLMFLVRMLRLLSSQKLKTSLAPDVG